MQYDMDMIVKAIERIHEWRDELKQQEEST
jgi:hypothetical protein